MLLVVLLSAAPTGGQPRTQIVGSAFDPATTSVAVSPKRPKVYAWTKKSVRTKDRDLIAAAASWAAIPAQPFDVLPDPPAAEHFDFASSSHLASSANPLALSHAARAPPSF